MLNNADPAKAQRVIKPMVQMGKIDIKKLKQAYHNEE
jgi:hypothetical protein